MTKEDLLRPRIEIIALTPWDNKETQIGDIIQMGILSKYFHIESLNEFRILTLDDVKQYPHLFREMKWWEKRVLEDLPKYVRVDETKTPGEMMYELLAILNNAKGHCSVRYKTLSGFHEGNYLLDWLLPADETEYNVFLSKIDNGAKDISILNNFPLAFNSFQIY